MGPAGARKREVPLRPLFSDCCANNGAMATKTSFCLSYLMECMILHSPRNVGFTQWHSWCQWVQYHLASCYHASSHTALKNKSLPRQRRIVGLCHQKGDPPNELESKLDKTREEEQSIMKVAVLLMRRARQTKTTKRKQVEVRSYAGLVVTVDGYHN
jgi:hypothetical protein